MERDIERWLVKSVKALGGKAYKFTSPGRRGVADRLVVLPGGAVWFVEVKAPEGRLSALQRVFAQDMERLGQRYVCLWDREQVNEWIRNL